MSKVWARGSKQSRVEHRHHVFWAADLTMLIVELCSILGCASQLMGEFGQGSSPCWISALFSCQRWRQYQWLEYYLTLGGRWSDNKTVWKFIFQGDAEGREDTWRKTEKAPRIKLSGRERVNLHSVGGARGSVCCPPVVHLPFASQCLQSRLRRCLASTIRLLLFPTFPAALAIKHGSGTKSWPVRSKKQKSSKGISGKANRERWSCMPLFPFILLWTWTWCLEQQWPSFHELGDKPGTW